MNSFLTNKFSLGSTLLISLLFSLSAYGQEEVERTPLEIANQLFKEAKYKESFVLFRELLKKEPLNLLYRFNIANNLLKMNFYEKALIQYDKVAKRSKELRASSLIYKAYCYRELDKRGEALRVLYEVLQSKLTEAEYLLLEGELEEYSDQERDEYIRLGEDKLNVGSYRFALEYFEKAWVINPTDELYHLMGKAYFALGDLEEAENQFSYIRDDALYKESIKLIDPDAFKKVEEPQERKPRFFSIYMDVAYGKNSNPYTQSDADGTTIESDNQTDFFGGVITRIVNTDSWQFGVSADHYRQKFSSDSTINSTGSIVSLPVTYVPSHGKWDLTVSPQYEMTTYGGDDYTDNKVLAFDYHYYKVDFRSSYNYTYTDYDPGTSDYYYLNGVNHSFSSTWTRYLKNQELSFGLDFSKEELDDTSDNIGSNVAYGARIGGYFQLREKWSLDTEISYTTTQYEPDSSGFHQKDGAFEVSALVRWSLKTWFDVYLKDEFIANSSNLDNDTDDNNYKQNTLQLGLSFYY